MDEQKKPDNALEKTVSLIDTLIPDDCTELAKILLNSRYASSDLDAICQEAARKNGEGFYFKTTHYRFRDPESREIIKFVAQYSSARHEIIEKLAKRIDPQRLLLEVPVAYLY